MAQSNHTLKSLFESQLQIVYMISTKYEILECIKVGYEENKNHILMSNRFLHYTATILHDSLIIELNTLFSRDANEKNRFKLYYQYKEDLIPENLLHIQKVLKQSSKTIKTVVDLRNKNIAHYDPIPDEETGGVRLNRGRNWNYFNEIKELKDAAVQILECVSQSIEDGLSFTANSRSSILHSLEGLIKDAEIGFKSHSILHAMKQFKE